MEVMEKVNAWEEEEDPGMHQHDDDLIILDQTEDDLDTVEVDQPSVYNRLGAKSEGDLRLSLTNKTGNNFICFTIIPFLPIFKQIRQFLKKGDLFIREKERERCMLTLLFSVLF